MFFGIVRKRKKKIDHIRRHILHMLHADDDILPEKTKKMLDEIVIEALSINPKDEAKSNAFIDSAPERIRKFMKPNPFAGIRDFLDVIAVAFMVAFGIRALFFQPFKIPTSSMQPTLFGIHFIEKNVIHNLGQPLSYLLYSAERAKLEVKQTGIVGTNAYSYNSYKLFPQTVFSIGDIKYTLPGDLKQTSVYTRMSPLQTCKEGEVLCDGWLSLGDHLFVDRFSHHIAGFKRGDVVIFNTENIKNSGEDLAGYYYIKRLIGLPGDTLTIKNNMVYVKPKGESTERPITEFNKTFKKVYSGNGGYQGHLNIPRTLYLNEPSNSFTVPEDSYFVMGDNASNSLDSRYWGVVPRENMVGKGFLIFWPFSRRWGMVDSVDALPFQTDRELNVMKMQ